MTIPVLPDPETMLMYALVPQNPSTWRFVTILPSADPTPGNVVVRIRRVSGTNRHIGMDRPIVDVDVFGLKSDVGNVSSAAREIQAQILALMSAVVSNGVFQHTSTVTGPRQLPEVNPNIIRYSATYELQTYSL